MELTSRELQVLRLIASGKSSKQVAGELGIAFRTVVCHRYRIFQKLGVHNTAELVMFAVRAGMTDPLHLNPKTPLPDQSVAHRLSVARDEQNRERQRLAALLAESRELRQSSMKMRLEFRELRRRVVGQVQQLVVHLSNGTGRNPQIAADVCAESSVAHSRSTEHVLSAGGNEGVSSVQ